MSTFDQIMMLLDYHDTNAIVEHSDDDGNSDDDPILLDRIVWIIKVAWDGGHKGDGLSVATWIHAQQMVGNRSR